MSKITITAKQLRQLCDENEDDILIPREDLMIYDWPHIDGKPTTYPREITSLKADENDEYIIWFETEHGYKDGYEVNFESENDKIDVLINIVTFVEVKNLEDIL